MLIQSSWELVGWILKEPDTRLATWLILGIPVLPDLFKVRSDEIPSVSFDVATSVDAINNAAGTKSSRSYRLRRTENVTSIFKCWMPFSALAGVMHADYALAPEKTSPEKHTCIDIERVEKTYKEE